MIFFLPAVFFLVHFVQYRHVPVGNKNIYKLTISLREILRKGDQINWPPHVEGVPDGHRESDSTNFSFPFFAAQSRSKNFLLLRGLAAAAVRSEDGCIADKMNRKSRSKRPFRNQFILNIL